MKVTHCNTQSDAIWALCTDFESLSGSRYLRLVRSTYYIKQIIPAKLFTFIIFIQIFGIRVYSVANIYEMHTQTVIGLSPDPGQGLEFYKMMKSIGEV